MSVAIEYADTINSNEDIQKKCKQLEDWVEIPLSEKWNQISFTPNEIQLFDQPQQEQKHIMLSKTIIHAPVKTIYNYLTTANYEEMKLCDKDLLEYEFDQRNDEESYVINRNCYKAPWPVTAREFVEVAHWFEKDDFCYIVRESINYSSKWNAVNKKYVRGYKKYGLVLKPINENDTEATRITIIDARGSIPSWLTSSSKKDEANRLLEYKQFFEKTKK
ncbi:START domain-containing protein [Entamoeba marina]